MAISRRRGAGPPRRLIDAAFASSGEKHRHLAGVFYRALFGRTWGYAFLGFAYLKYVDDRVDSERDVARARQFLRRQLARLEPESRAPAEPEEGPEAFAVELLRWDRSRGSPLTPLVARALHAIGSDIDRRHKRLSRCELERWSIDVGAAPIRYLAHFAAPEERLSDEGSEPLRWVALGCAAYVLADCIVDWEEDREQGLVAVSSEDAELLHLGDHPDDAGIERWIRYLAPEVLDRFAAALAATRDVRSARLRLLVRRYLKSKRRELTRFLEQAGIA